MGVDERAEGGRNRPGNDQFGHGLGGRSGPQRHDPQRRGRIDHAQRGASSASRRWSSARTPARPSRSHPDMVAQWVKRDMGAPFYSHPIHGHYLPPEVIQACILRKLKADAGRRLGPDAAGRDHRAGLFRRDAPQGHRRRRRDGRPAGPGHRQRADGRGPGLRRGPGLPVAPPECPKSSSPCWSTTWAAAPSTSRCLRLAAGKVADPGHRRRRAAWRPRLGPAAGRLRGRVLPASTHQLDPREDPGHARTACTSTPWRPSTRSPRGAGRSIHINYAGPLRRSRRHPRAVRGDDGRSAGTHCLHLAATAGRRRPGMEGRAAGPAGGRFDADAHGRPHAAEALRHRARPHGQSRRGGRPRGRPVCRPPAGRARRRAAAAPSRSPTSTPTAWASKASNRTRSARPTSCSFPATRRCPPRHTERFATKSEGQRSIVDQGPRGGKLAAGRVHRHRPHRGPRPARRAAQGLAGGSHLRVRRPTAG